MIQLLSIDPGKSKCGIAIIDVKSRKPLLREIVFNNKLKDGLTVFFQRFKISRIVIGNGTTHKQILADVESVARVSFPEDNRPEILIVDEKNTTIRARYLYLEENPLCFPFCLIPKGLIPVNRPVDHYAAYIIGTDYLENLESGSFRFNKNIW